MKYIPKDKAWGGGEGGLRHPASFTCAAGPDWGHRGSWNGVTQDGGWSIHWNPFKWCRWTQRLWHCYQFKVVVTDFNVYNHIPWNQRFHVKLMIKNLHGTQCLSLVLAGTNQRHRFYGVFSKMRISFFLKERCLLFPPTFVTITRFCPHSLETKC